MRRLQLAILALVVLCNAFAVHAADDPWAAPPFSVEPKTLLALAPAPAHDGPGITVLLDEATFTFDAEGRCTSRYRLVFSAGTQASAEAWGSVEREWAPWHEERPEIRARVIGPDGAVHLLDPSTVADAPAGDGEPDVFGNRRSVRVPLPAMAAGVVVEEEILVRESRPLFGAGVVRRFTFGRYVPVQSGKLVVDAPAGLPVRTAVTPEGAVRASRREEEGRVRLTFAAGPVAAYEHLEEGADRRQAASVAFSTGESWQRVAAEYEKVVVSQLAGAALEPLVKPLVSASDPPRAVAAKLLRKMQHDVRYTGVEFDEATIVPRPPSETLRRRYGDCKDKAALLVAMLGAAGVRAHVALLQSGSGIDVDPDLPGFGAFDHAIVHVPGTDPFWIDPTAEFSRVGELPAADAGRLALVASETTTALVSTPEAEAKDSLTAETREFFLAETGPARVVETSEWSGRAAAVWRGEVARTAAKKMSEQLAGYVKDEYLARKDPSWKAGEVADLESPFQLRIEVPEAGRGMSDDTEAVVVIFPSQLPRALPRTLSPSSEDEDEEAAVPSAPKKHRKRVTGYVFPNPFTTEWRYRAVPPPGFAPAALPEGGELHVGTGTLTRRFTAETDGTIRAVLRFESRRRRVTAEEFEGWRHDLEKLGKEGPIFLRFRQTGALHLREGRVREALQEFRRLAALHPKEALHHAQLSGALLQGGLGGAARAEAREAIRVEPASARAHRTLGWALQHDLLGRRFKPGWERDAAIAAYRRAKELDPKDVVARADLAILLEHDAQGLRYGPTASLSDAATEYRTLRKEQHEKRYDSNLLLVLLWSRDWEALAETARALDPSPERSQALVLATTMRAGPEAGIREASLLVSDPGERRTALQRVGGSLVQLREYARATALLSEAAAGAPNEAKLRAGIEFIARTRNRDTLPPPADDPAGVVRRLFGRLAAPDAAGEEMRALFTKPFRDRWARERSGLASVRRLLTASGLPLDVIVDLALSNFDISAQGSDGAGWRVSVRGAAGQKNVNETFFVTREDGVCKIAGLGRVLAELGWEARRRLEAGDLPGARQWLDWVREELRAPGPDDPYLGSAFARAWTRGSSADEPTTRLAVALLLAQTPDDPNAITALTSARERASGPEDRDVIEHALALGGVLRKNWKDAESFASLLLERHPDSDAAFTWRIAALRRLDRHDEARAACQERRRRRPNDEPATRELALLEQELERYPEAAALLGEVLASSRVEAGDYNNAAWAALFTGGPFDVAIDRARRGVEMTAHGSSTELHTLATLLAEGGRAAEAREVIVESIGLHAADAPEPEDWYVLGRIAEIYGETASAAEAYNRVTRGEARTHAGGSTWLLARRRLAPLAPADRIPTSARPAG